MRKRAEMNSLTHEFAVIDNNELNKNTGKFVIYDKKLLKIHPFNEKGKLIINTSIYEDDLTPFGEIVFNDLMYDWLYYADNKSGKIDRKSNIKMLDKYYNKLVSKYQEELNKVALWQNLYEKILKEPLLLPNV